MKTRILSIASLALLCLALMSPVSTHAVALGLQIEVEVDSGAGFVSKGSALGTDASPFDVGVSVGDTVRFTVKLLGTPEFLFVEFLDYSTDITADDPTEIDFIAASGVPLLGAFISDPNSTLTDGTPGVGAADAMSPVVIFGTDEPLYELQYTVQAGLTSDASIDFSVDGDSLFALPLTDEFASDGTEIANVRLNVAPLIPALSLPGVAVFLLLAVAAIFVIRQRRSRSMSG